MPYVWCCDMQLVWQLFRYQDGARVAHRRQKRVSRRLLNGQITSAIPQRPKRYNLSLGSRSNVLHTKTGAGFDSPRPAPDGDPTVQPEILTLGLGCDFLHECGCGLLIKFQDDASRGFECQWALRGIMMPVLLPEVTSTDLLQICQRQTRIWGHM